jgi:hypothetical protein
MNAKPIGDTEMLRVLLVALMLALPSVAFAGDAGTVTTVTPAAVVVVPAAAPVLETPAVDPVLASVAIPDAGTPVVLDAGTPANSTGEVTADVDDVFTAVKLGNWPYAAFLALVILLGAFGFKVYRGKKPKDVV